MNQKSPSIDINQDSEFNKEEILIKKLKFSSFQQSSCSFLYFTFLYYLVSILCFYYISPYWGWTLYLSPLFVIFLLIISCIYNCLLQDLEQIKDDNLEDSSKKEQNFCVLNILLPFYLFWWPLFIIFYFGIYDSIISLKYQQVQQNSGFYGEILDKGYTILMIGVYIDDQFEIGYGCSSTQNQAEINQFSPRPYIAYEVDELLPVKIQKIIKLPSWLCTNQINETLIPQKLFYTNWGENIQKIKNLSQIIDLSDNFRLISFSPKPFIPSLSFAMIIGFVYEFMWIFSVVLILTFGLLINERYIDYQQTLDNEFQKAKKAFQFDFESKLKNQKKNTLRMAVQILRPSRLRRLLFQTFSFISWLVLLVYILIIENKKFQILLLIHQILPGFLLLILSLLSRSHSSFISLLLKLWSSFKQIVLNICSNQIGTIEKIFSILYLIIFPIMIYLICLIYLLFINFIGQWIYIMRIYYCRHFVSFWNGRDESTMLQKDYDQQITRIILCDFIWRGILLLLILVINGIVSTKPLKSVYISCVITAVLQILFFVISCFTAKNSENFLLKPSKILYKETIQQVQISNEICEYKSIKQQNPEINEINIQIN